MNGKMSNGFPNAIVITASPVNNVPMFKHLVDKATKQHINNMDYQLNKATKDLKAKLNANVRADIVSLYREIVETKAITPSAIKALADKYKDSKVIRGADYIAVTIERSATVKGLTVNVIHGVQISARNTDTHREYRAGILPNHLTSPVARIQI